MGNIFTRPVKNGKELVYPKTAYQRADTRALEYGLGDYSALRLRHLHTAFAVYYLVAFLLMCVLLVLGYGTDVDTGYAFATAHGGALEMRSTVAAETFMPVVAALFFIGHMIVVTSANESAEEITRIGWNPIMAVVAIVASPLIAAQLCILARIADIEKIALVAFLSMLASAVDKTAVVLSNEGDVAIASLFPSTTDAGTALRQTTAMGIKLSKTADGKLSKADVKVDIDTLNGNENVIMATFAVINASRLAVMKSMLRAQVVTQLASLCAWIAVWAIVMTNVSWQVRFGTGVPLYTMPIIAGVLAIFIMGKLHQNMNITGRFAGIIKCAPRSMLHREFVASAGMAAVVAIMGFVGMN